MKKIRILLVGRSFYPRISPRSFRITEMAKELARQGHEVVVYVVKDGFDYTSFEREYNLKVKDLGALWFKGIIIKGNRFSVLLRRIVKRALAILIEYPDIELAFKVSRALRCERGYDLMVSFAVPFPVHWGCAKVLIKNKDLCKVWVADCGDPYMGLKTDKFKKPFYFGFLEKWFCRKADYITINGKELKGNYYPEFREKIRVIPQGFRFEDVVFSQVVENKIPTFAYAGSFIKRIRDPRPFLNYLVTLERDFKFIVYTKDPGFLAGYADLLKGKLEVRSYIPRLELLNILSSMDFLVTFDYNPRHQVPSKLIDYALTKRPILSLSSENFSGEYFNEFLEHNYSHKFVVEDIDQYNIKNVVNKFLALFAEKV